MIFTIGRHLQVVIESPESIARREENPRRRKRWVCFCTCKSKRQEGGHCAHTIALFREHLNPRYYGRITISPCETPAAGPSERPRVELERELVELRRRVRELEAV